MPHIGIVGHEAAKFTPETEAVARRLILKLLILVAQPPVVVVSGRCHLGGIDVWAEEGAAVAGVPTEIYPPATHTWASGYKPRNMRIAEVSDVVHVLVVKEYPPNYIGMRFDYCYHCKTSDHIKSGGCWTGKYAERLGKPAHWHLI